MKKLSKYKKIIIAVVGVLAALALLTPTQLDDMAVDYLKTFIEASVPDVDTAAE